MKCTVFGWDCGLSLVIHLLSVVQCSVIRSYTVLWFMNNRIKSIFLHTLMFMLFLSVTHWQRLCKKVVCLLLNWFFATAQLYRWLRYCNRRKNLLFWCIRQIWIWRRSNWSNGAYTKRKIVSIWSQNRTYDYLTW